MYKLIVDYVLIKAYILDNMENPKKANVHERVTMLVVNIAQ